MHDESGQPQSTSSPALHHVAFNLPSLFHLAPSIHVDDLFSYPGHPSSFLTGVRRDLSPCRRSCAKPTAPCSPHTGTRLVRRQGCSTAWTFTPSQSDFRTHLRVAVHGRRRRGKVRVSRRKKIAGQLLLEMSTYQARRSQDSHLLPSPFPRPPKAMGALTKGDRRAEIGSLDAFNLDTVWGKRALKALLRAGFEGETTILPHLTDNSETLALVHAAFAGLGASTAKDRDTLEVRVGFFEPPAF